MTRTAAELYAEEQVARLERVGLTEDVIAENENAPRIPEPAHRCPIRDVPDLLPLSKLTEYAEIDGFVDAALDRPPCASIRFIEARLHYENMGQFGAYCDVYTRAYQARRKS